MKTIFSISLIALMSMHSAKEDVLKTLNEDKTLVLIELFTSEGCSSCPPADKLLSQYAAKNHVIALSFHVHYWDRLGWSDPYSDQKYTDRQRDYSQALNIRRIFTPQMIVDGTHSFVGSDKEEAERFIGKSENKTKEVEITITNITIDGNFCRFKYHLNETNKSTMVNFALTEDGLNQQVLRGENRGKLLKHNNVVRAFKAVSSPKKSDEVLLRIPEDANKCKMQVVVYTQKVKTMEVTGASAKKLGQ